MARHLDSRLPVVMMTLSGLGVAQPAGAAPFDFDTGNAALEVVIPTVRPVVIAQIAPSDASLVVRTTAVITNGFFDAIAPYHPTAVGVYSRLPRRPAEERQNERQRNIALLYATQEVLGSLYPAERARWAAMLSSVGLDPKAEGGDVATPEGIGRAAGRAVATSRARDGMNQLGDAGGRAFNRQPYADTTGYRPVNPPDRIIDPTRWQPAIVSRNNGVFSAQIFVTPQYGLTKPYSYSSAAAFSVPPPAASQLRGPDGSSAYKAQADAVLAASASLTDAQKMTAELFNNKFASLGASSRHLARVRRWSVDQFVQYDFLVNMAAFDAGIAVWQEKRRHDAVRPFTAIRHLYGDRKVNAWGGPGRGTTSLPASQWTSYLGVGDHPEYPSGSSCFCAAQAELSRLFLGSDELGWTIHYAQGSSQVEPGITPAADMALTFDTWTRFEAECGQSRLWGGVHFQAAIDSSKALCRAIARGAYRFLSGHIDGSAAHETRGGG